MSLPFKEGQSRKIRLPISESINNGQQKTFVVAIVAFFASVIFFFARRDKTRDIHENIQRLI